MTIDVFDELGSVGRELRDMTRLIDCAEPCPEKDQMQANAREAIWCWVEFLERFRGIVRNHPTWPPPRDEIQAMLTRELKSVLVVLDQAQAFLAAQKCSVN